MFPVAKGTLTMQILPKTGNQWQAYTNSLHSVSQTRVRQVVIMGRVSISLQGMNVTPQELTGSAQLPCINDMLLCV